MNALQPADAAQLPAEPGQGGSLLNFVAQAVSDPAVDVAKLEALLRMQREIVADEAKAQFNAALHAAQQAMPRVRKNGTIELGSDKATGQSRGSIPFAKWEDVDAVLRPIMRTHGFSLSFDMAPRPDGGGAVITGTLMHVGGYAKTASIPLALDTGPGRNNLQAMGSTLSYGKRYLAEMFFNVVREGADDDGKLGGTVYIKAAQKERLVELMQEVKADTTNFLRFLGVSSLDEIEERNFGAAVNALMAKKAKGKVGGKHEQARS